MNVIYSTVHLIILCEIPGISLELDLALKMGTRIRTYFHTQLKVSYKLDLFILI